MKKLLISLLSLLILAGCSAGSNKLKNGNEAIFTIGNKKLTKDTVYKIMTSSGAYSKIITDADTYIVNQEIKETSADVTKEAQEILNTYKTIYGDQFEAIKNNANAKTDEEFIEKTLIPGLNQIELNKNYIRENYDTYITNCKPRKVQILNFKTADEANKALDILNTGTSIEDYAKNNDYTSSIEPKIVTLDDELSYDIKVFIDTTDKTGYSDIIMDATNNTYHIVNMIEMDPNAIKEDAILKLAENKDIIKEIQTFYYKKYNFNLYVADMYDDIAINYPHLLGK